MRQQEMPLWLCRFGPAALLLAVYLAMSSLYLYGDRNVYERILTAYGIAPFRTPFVDISGSLASWECARLGFDVIASNPCDVLQRVHIYSPLWLAGAAIPLGVSDTAAVGWGLGLLFLLSLPLLPPRRRPLEFVLVLMATFSTMVVFALERANADLLLFIMALATGCLAEHGPVARTVGYLLALLSALLKYYPITALIVMSRERAAFFVALALLLLGSLAVFGAAYHTEIVRGLPNIPGGRYDTDLFGAENLPFLLGTVAAAVAQASRAASAIAWTTKAGLYAMLVGASLAICWKLSRLAEWRGALGALAPLEHILLVIGSAVIAGCFFAGQSIGYRGIFLLLVIPGLLALARSTVGAPRALCFGTATVIVFLMWGECLRLALGGSFGFWLVRELCWWWTVSIMIAVLADFLLASPVVRSALPLAARPPAGVR